MCVINQAAPPESAPMISPQIYFEEFEKVAACLASLQRQVPIMFPTGGTLIAAMRWGHTLAFTGTRWNLVDLDIDIIVIVADQNKFRNTLQVVAMDHPDLQFTWRGTGKAVKIETSKPYAYVPDNHRNVWRPESSPCTVYADLYVLEVDDTTWKASRPEEVKRDFEFWDQGDYLDIKDWASVLTNPAKVVLGPLVMSTPANPEHSVLRKWQNCCWASSHTLWLPLADYFCMASYFHEPFAGASCEEIDRMLTRRRELQRFLK